MEQNYNCLNVQWLSHLAAKTSKQNSMNRFEKKILKIDRAS